MKTARMKVCCVGIKRVNTGSEWVEIRRRMLTVAENRQSVGVK